MSRPKIRWSGPELATEDDASNYGIPVGSLLVWAGEADDAGHVEPDDWRHLPPAEHDGVRNAHGIVLCGPATDEWVETVAAEMVAELRKCGSSL